jgi:hypothetical protein
VTGIPPLTQQSTTRRLDRLDRVLRQQPDPTPRLVIRWRRAADKAEYPSSEEGQGGNAMAGPFNAPTSNAADHDT